MLQDTLAVDSATSVTASAAATPAAAPAAAAPETAAAAPDTLAETVHDAVTQAVPALGRAEAAAERASDALNRALDDPPPVKPDAPRSPEAWTRLVDALHDVTGLGHAVVANLLLTILAVGLLWAVRRVVLAGVRRRSADPKRLYTWTKTSQYVAVALGLVAVLRIWLGELGTFGTFLGLLTAGVAIALRDPLVNLAGWLFIVWKRPFAPGDRVTVRTHTGDVIDQRLFQFTLLEVGTATGALQSTGRLIHVPNGWVFSDSVVNATGAFAYVWHEIPVTVTFESDWRAAKAMLTAVAAEHAETLAPDAERTLRAAAREHFIFYSKLTPVVYTSVVENGVRLTLRYLVAPRRIRGSEEAIWEAVLDAVGARDDVALAYPTSRIFRGSEEGRFGGSVQGEERGPGEAGRD